MDATPLVSVIMPAYNCEASVGEAIRSVLAQTEGTLELIVVDDASTDSTAEVLYEYAATDSRVVLIRNPRNSRQAPIQWEARNDGLRVARGELIAYLDADNTWHRDFVERMACPLFADPCLQVTHCDSKNHYASAEAAAAIATDPRRLMASGPTWTVFHNGPLSRDRLGVDQYVDTNEMMHRASVFQRLGNLWRTCHPRRSDVQRCMRSLRQHRRYNDLDLFERIVDAYGMQSARYVPEVLVDYHYDQPERRALPSPAEPPDPIGTVQRERVATASAIHPEMRAALPFLNVAHFYSGYPSRPSPPGLLDLGLGEISVPDLDLCEAYEGFVASGGVRERLVRYNGSAKVTEALAVVAAYYGRVLGDSTLTERNIVPFDGCHEALSCAVGLFTGSAGNPAGRDTVTFPVPSYPYWAIAAAGRCRPRPIEAYDAAGYLRRLEDEAAGSVGAVVVNWPHNPLGYGYSETEVGTLSRLARDRGWGIVTDITYQEFCRPATAGLRDLAPERTVFCASASKAWGVPGLRLGFAVCADPDLAAVLRAAKSGRSLLPSSLKVAFFGHLVSDRPEIPALIVAAVHDRRRRLRDYWRCRAPVNAGLTLAPEFAPGMYEILDVVPAMGATPEEVAVTLLRHAAVRVTPDSAFFPPGYGRPPRRRFLRLSLGRVDDIEGVAAAVLGHTCDEFRSAS